MISDSKSPNQQLKKQIPVYLNIYNFWSCFNQACSIFGIGVYHTGVQIYDDEYMFFGFDGDQTGVGFIEPYTASYQFSQQILLGYTSYNFFQFDDEILDPLRLQFKGNTYDLLANNCNHFSKRLAKQLHLQQKFPTKIFALTNCCNLFRCCIPECILNGRLDWLNSSQTESCQDGYQQLHEPVNQQFDMKIIKSKMSTPHSPRQLEQMNTYGNGKLSPGTNHKQLNEQYNRNAQSAVKQDQINQHHPDFHKHTTLRKGIWPHTQNAHERISLDNSKVSIKEKKQSYQDKKLKSPRLSTQRYPNQDLKMFTSQAPRKQQNKQQYSAKSQLVRQNNIQ